MDIIIKIPFPATQNIDRMSDSQPTKIPQSEPKRKVTPLNCLFGATISASFAFALYNLTSAIAHSFATNPIVSQKPIVLRISSLVRSLVIGISSLGTFIFVFVAFGLILLAIQLLIQKKPSEG